MGYRSRRINNKAYNLLSYIVVIVGTLLFISGVVILLIGLIR